MSVYYELEYMVLISRNHPPSTGKTGKKATANVACVGKYRGEEIDRDNLSDLAEEDLGRIPFDRQLEAAETILRGEDLLLNVGTGNPTSLVFTLSLVLDSRDISVVVSPLSAFMTDQANWLASLFAVRQ